MARRKTTDEIAARVRNLIALDAANIIRRLEVRRDEMIVLFSRLRSREPMLSTLASRFATATFHDMLSLPVQEQVAVNQFYERLDELRWYFTYTEDMPSTAQQTFNTLHRGLEEAHRELVSAIGPPARPGERTVVAAKVVSRGSASPEVALARPSPPRKRRASPA